MVIIMQDRNFVPGAGHNKTVPIKERSVKGIFHQMHIVAQVQVVVKNLIEVNITGWELPENLEFVYQQDNGNVQ